MTNHLWQKTVTKINEKYNIKLSLNLSLCDINPSLLDKSFKEFNGYNFLPNEKIVITHIDTQCYIPSSKVSLTLYNLHATLSHYNIPTEMILFFTNHYGIEKELNFLADEFNFINPIKPIVSFYDNVGTLDNPKPIDINDHLVDHTFISLNGQKRSHRLLLISLLAENNLIDNNIVSTNFVNQIQKEQIDTNLTSDIRYFTCSIPTRIYERLKLTEKNNNIFRKHYSFFSSNNITHEKLYGQPNDVGTRWQPSFLQNALIYLVSETVGDYPYPFLTEKTFKGILIKRPMLIVGAKNSLEMLRQLGFKTWSKWWDEDYDNLDNLNDRVDCIINILKDFDSFSLITKQRICLEMQEVLNYNFNYYVNNFCDKDYHNYLQGI